MQICYEDPQANSLMQSRLARMRQEVQSNINLLPHVKEGVTNAY